MSKEIKSVSGTQSNLFHFALGAGMLILGGLAYKREVSLYIPVFLGLGGVVFLGLGFYRLLGADMNDRSQEAKAKAFEKYKIKEKLKGRDVELTADRLAKETGKAEPEEDDEAIPAAKPAPKGGALGGLLGRVGVQAQRGRRPLRFLVVEDDFDDRRRVKNILDAGFDGCETVAVEHGALAVNELVKQPFDLMVTGLNMPGMSGMDLLTHVKRQHPKLPVIVVSALGHLKRGECLKEGAVDCMVKPANKHILGAAVRKALGLPAEAD